MTGPHQVDMLTFKYAVCGDSCETALDYMLVDMIEKYHPLIEEDLTKALADLQKKVLFKT